MLWEKGLGVEGHYPITAGSSKGGKPLSASPSSLASITFGMPSSIGLCLNAILSVVVHGTPEWCRRAGTCRAAPLRPADLRSGAERRGAAAARPSSGRSLPFASTPSLRATLPASDPASCICLFTRASIRSTIWKISSGVSAMEDDHLVDAVQELGPEHLLHLVHDAVLHRLVRSFVVRAAPRRSSPRIPMPRSVGLICCARRCSRS